MDQTIDELEQMARDTTVDLDQRLNALEELTKRVSEQLGPAFDEAARRMTSLLRELLNRPGADSAGEERLTAFAIESAVLIGASELLPEIDKAFAEDRVDPENINQSMVYEGFDLPEPPSAPRSTNGLYLLLKCGVCGRTREHFSRFLIVDESSLSEKTSSNRSPYLIDHEYVCPKCGAVEQYSLSPLEWIRLMQMNEAQILAMLEDRPPDRPLRPHPRMFYSRFDALGERIHPLELLSELRGRIATNPRNAALHNDLANLLRYIGRYEQSLEGYRKAVELEPKNLDYLYEAATAEHDYGDLQAARALYERILAAGRIQDFDALDENVRDSLLGLKALEQGERSPWDYNLINASGVRLMPPPRPEVPGGAAKKDKRRRRH